MLKACIGLNCVRQIDFIDRRHFSLAIVPEEVYRHERTLEELLLDFNAIQDLPPKFFRLTNLRKLTLSENDLNRIAPGIANLNKLVELDVSKNAIEEIPPNMQFCRCLAILDVSSNPLLRTPENVTSITSLTQLCLNDVAIPTLPQDIGNLKNLRILEARENLLKTVPTSIANCKRLRRLDVGNNEIDVLPDTIGDLAELTELWVDCNNIADLPLTIVNLKELTVLDATKNHIEHLPPGFAKLSNLSDLHLSENCIEDLPNDIGDLGELILIKLDFNHLTFIPESIGRLNKVTELLLFDNMLDAIPDTLFNMRSLEMLNVDRNHIMVLPSTVGNCKTLHVLSMRENELTDLPEELGRLHELTVLDVAGNKLSCLPYSLSDLKLDALWVDGSQQQPLIALVPESNPANPDQPKLTCMFLPQRGSHTLSMENFLEGESQKSDDPSINNNSVSRTGSFSRGAKLGVAFDPAIGPAPDDGQSKLVRFPTPFRKDMKAMKAKRKKTKGKYKPDATPSTTIFRKGSSSQDDLTLLSVNNSSAMDSSPTGYNEQEVSLTLPLPSKREEREKSAESLGGFDDIVAEWNRSPTLVPGVRVNGGEMAKEGTFEVGGDDGGLQEQSKLTKMPAMLNLSQDELTGVDLVQDTNKGSVSPPDATPDILKSSVYSTEPTELPASSQLQTIEVKVELFKEEGRSLGFSIAGGRGSTPAYEDVDESIFVTKIAPGGLAETDGRLRLGDKLISVNSRDMTNATHAEAVAGLKSVIDVCDLVVSREVLVVLPEDIKEEDEEEEEERAESPTALPSPTARLTFSGEGVSMEEEPPDELTGEDYAKKIVAEVLDRSVTRYAAESEASEQTEEMEKPEEGHSSPPHDNYVNYDIAQVVLESRPKNTPPEEEPGSVEIATRRAQDRRSTASGSFTYSLDEDEEFVVERVTLDRSIGKLGLSIVGGADHVSRVFGQGRPGVYISKISKGGAAEATGKLKLGDRILEVGHFDVRYATHQQAVQWLISQDGDISLLVQHVPQPDGLEEVLLQKRPNEKLGISIRGGGKGSKGNPLDPDDEGIFISKITNGGAAERDGRLLVGLRLLEVNGTSLLGASHIEAVKALRSAPENIYITVCTGYDPQEVLKRKMEAEASAVARGEKIPLSAASSIALDDAVHRMLSDSMDLLPQKSYSAVAPSHYAIGNSKIISQSLECIEKPVTAEDLDGVLKGLAEFSEAIHSKPPEIKVEEIDNDEPSTSPKLEPIPLSEILGPLQQGGLSLDFDLPDISLLSNDSEDTPMNQSQEDLIDGEEDELQAELLNASMEDTSSMLAALDSEVSLMQDEVSKTEDEIELQQQQEEEEEEERKKKEEELKKQAEEKKREAEVKPKPDVLHLSVGAPPVVLASPETRRRVDQMKLKIDAPGNQASKDAVSSIIGEVFDDVSFEEFEIDSTPRSGYSSGLITPSSDTLHGSSRQSSGDLEALLSALQDIGEEKTPPVTAPVKKEPAVVKETVKTHAVSPLVEGMSPPRQRANTQPSVERAKANEVTLRVPSPKKDPAKRLSAPPNVLKKPGKYAVSPEKLSFKEKLALHKKAAGTPGSVSQTKANGVRKQRPLSSALEVEHSMKRTSSDGVVVQASLANKIASFESKAEVEPVAASNLTTERRLSLEEKRLARLTRTGSDDMKSTAAPVVSDTNPSEDSDPMESGPSDPYLSASEDPPLSDPVDNQTPIIAVNEEGLPPAVSVNGNTNNSNLDDKNVQTCIASDSPYVARILADMPPLVQPPADEELTREDRGEEWKRRRAWREEKMKQLNTDFSEARSLLSEDTTGSSQDDGTENAITADSLNDSTEQH